MYKRKRSREEAEPQKKKNTTTTSRKRRRQTHQLNTTKYQIRHLFTQPTDAQYSTAAVALKRTPHAHHIQSLRKHTHISSAAIDDIIILLIRPRLPLNTALLLCHDSYFMSCTDMTRHQTRIRNVVNTHSTTLIPLFDSAHWFLVEVNTDTTTFTFYNSYGKHGQRKWSPTFKAWLTHHMHGPWTAAQGIAPQQPGTTECGTHTHYSTS